MKNDRFVARPCTDLDGRNVSFRGDGLYPEVDYWCHSFFWSKQVPCVFLLCCVYRCKGGVPRAGFCCLQVGVGFQSYVRFNFNLK